MYQIIISKSAEKDMDRLPRAVLKKVEIAIDQLFKRTKTCRV